MAGDSRGRWEGNTLVVEATNFRFDPVGYNKQPWIDSHGTFYSDTLRVVERWKFVDANTVDYEATIEDPKVYTQPWKIAYQIQRLREKNFELIEEACWEGVSVSNRLEAAASLQSQASSGSTVTVNREVAMLKTAVAWIIGAVFL